LLTARNYDELKIKINGALEYMIGWFSANALTLNVENTNIMKLTAIYKQNKVLQITYQNKIITGIHITKSLGLELDKNVSWKNSVQNIIHKVNIACNWLEECIHVAQQALSKLFILLIFMLLWNIVSYCGEIQ
jgi:hypothetical protein